MSTLSGLVGSKTSYKGNYDASGNTVPSAAGEGDIYKVTVSGTLNGNFYGVGDMFLMQNGIAQFLCGEATTNTVLGHTSDISTNTTDISTNAGNIATNTSDISTNTANIGTNTADIATNTGAIATNVTDIGANTTAIGTNTTDIATNATDIGNNTTNITANTSNIGTNATDIGTNATNISTNATNISSVTSDLSTHEGLGNQHIDWTVAQGGPEIEITNLPDSIQNGMVYVGEWDASTNTPTLSDVTGLQGNYYRVSVAGTQDLGSGSATYEIGDRIVHDDVKWVRWAAADEVHSVFGRLGDVVAETGDYDAVQVDYTPSATIESTATDVKGGLDNLSQDSYVEKSIAFTAKPGGKYNANTNIAAYVATLPLGVGDETIIFHDIAGTWGTNNVSVTTTSAQTIAGLAAPLALDISGAKVELAWSTQQSTWLVNVLN